MDNSRDIQRSNSSLLDSDAIYTNPFRQNKSGQRIYRRAERLAAALHLLTNHIPSTEPVRLEIRVDSLRLLASILRAKDEMRVTESTAIREVQAIARELISLVRIACFSGYISTQNSRICTEALDELGSYLVTSQRSPLSESTLLSKDDLADDMRSGTLSYTSIIGGKHEIMNRTSDTAAQRNVRESRILEFLRTRGPRGISDIAANLPEYSEKMIQRELASLVGRGLIKRAGLKRWSTYSLEGNPLPSSP